MAKRGLALYFMLSFGITITGYLFYAHFKYTPPLTEHPFDTYKRLEGTEVLLTQNQIRKMGERSKHKDVPTADDEEGYM